MMFLLMVVCGLMACAQKVPNMVKIEEDTYMDDAEVGIEWWIEYDEDVAKRSGADSPERLAVAPDDKVFRSLYGKSYESIKKDDELKNRYGRCPIVGLSREQISKYCKWRTEKCSQMKGYQPHGHVLEFGLPDKDDYDAGTRKAKYTENDAGTPTPQKRGGKIYGLYDNVAEIYQGVTPPHPYGFRCVAREVE